jgi:acetyl esterase/lipase
MLTAFTDFLLRRTVKRWFANDADVRNTRRKLARFIGLTDRLSSAWKITPAGPGLFIIAPTDTHPGDAPLVVYMHGGGYIVGGLPSHAAFCARLGKALGARILFADYRLAPEHPFPAAFDDGLAAWRAATGMATGQLYLAGDSAGGGLALAVAQAAIAQGLRAPDKIILLSPWTDLTLTGESLAATAATDSMLSVPIVDKMRTLYLAGHDPADARASPLFDANTKLPPTLLIYSTTELIADDSRRLARQLRAGGTLLTEAPFDGLPHVFPILPAVPASRRALKQIAAFGAA